MLRFVRPLSCASVVAWGWIFASLCMCQQASAQTDVLNELYGSGVHAYNSGQSKEAYDDLTMAIRSGSKDPRVYYYRGLAYLRLGRPQEAQGDFKKAASLEMADSDHFYPVSKSLERVQGYARAQIERYRSQARLVAYQSRERQRFERYQRIRKNEPNVLMPGEATEMPTPAEPSEEMEAETPPAKPRVPTPAVEEPAEEMPAEEPEAEETPAEEMPTEAPEKEEGHEKPDDDPFAEEGDENMPADEAVEKEEPPQADGDESAEEKKADDDPFAN